MTAGLAFALAITICAAQLSGAGDPPAWFQDVTKTSGLDFRHTSGHEGTPYYPEIMGGGAALFDMDGDADLDAYLVQSGSLTAPRGEVAGNRLYRNRGDGTFEDVTEGSGAGDRGYGMGVAVGDFDDDGDADLYVTNLGPNALLRNDGGGRFRDVTGVAGVGDPAWGVSSAFADLDADGDLDLFVTNYVDWSIASELECRNALGEIDYCRPANYGTPRRDTLFRNDGDGTFKDVSEEAGLASALGYGLGVTCADFDGDGRPDVFVANDTAPNHLWRNLGELRFVEEGLLRGCAVDGDGLAKAATGVAAADTDDDGDRDLLVVSRARLSDTYYENDGGLFRDRTVSVGLGVVSRLFTGFGTGFRDFDNDGRLDLYVAAGRVAAASSPLSEDVYAESNRLFRGGPGRVFTEVFPRGGTPEEHRFTSRAATFGDVDSDGGVDVLVVNRDGPAQLFRNTVPDRGNWIAVRLEERTGRVALGAVVTGRVGSRQVTRDVMSGSSYCASSDPTVHLGLGDADRVEDVNVRWADGAEEHRGTLEANRIHEIVRGGSRH